MHEPSFGSGTRAGTLGGTFTIILANISTADLLQTTLLAAIGATVSFMVTLLLKKIMKK